MKTIKLYQVDAFTDKLFSGNPAAVCMLDSWLPDDLMQRIAMENNLAETAFVVPKEGAFEIRWFTPTIEVDLCGHATLASAYVLFTVAGYPGAEIRFYSPRSGWLTVFPKDDLLYLDFPTDTLQPASEEKAAIEQCIGVPVTLVYKGKTDYMAIIKNETELRQMNIDLQGIAKLKARGLIITAKGDTVDFVSRFFAPQSGIDEDPVTGSAHTSLTPVWSQRLGKTQLTAAQLSARGGQLYCTFKGDRCLIGGKARLYLTGEINIE